MQFLSPGWIVTNNNRQRPCINEVLGSIDVVSHGQFGNWCIQHICEHGAAPDKTRAIENVLRYATEYSTDQFASKVVEKCLKVSGTEFLDRYLEKVCEGRADRPRMPLIDIAGDQVCFSIPSDCLYNADQLNSMATTLSSTFSSMPINHVVTSLAATSENISFLCGAPNSVSAARCCVWAVEVALELAVAIATFSTG